MSHKKLAIRKRIIGTIPVLEVVPQEQVYQALPLVIYYHGWQTSKELVLTQARKIANEGVRVVLPDAMNHGERKTDKSTIPSLTFWQSIHTNLFEFESIVAYFQRLDVTNGKIGVGGVSMGGMTTCALLTHHPEIQAAACIMGSPDLQAYKDRLQGHARMFQLFLPKDYQDLLGWTDAYDLAQQPQKRGNRPLLFWHGTADEKIPISHVERFVLQNPSEQITFVKEREKHLVKGTTMELVASFFKEHLA